MRLEARGKINLALDVTGVRDNGYHDVRMIMQSVDLHDSLELDKSERPGIRLSVDDPDLTAGEDNLICRAAGLLMDEFGLEGGLDVRLEKRIPLAAGMAGGSADAAAALIGVNEVFGLGLSRRELMERGVKLGADIPFCLMEGTALSEGIGEVLTELPPVPDFFLVLGKPDVGVSTGEIYRRLDGGPILTHPDVDGMAGAIERGDLAGIVSRLGNVLADVTIPLHPVIAEMQRFLEDRGALGTLMSGSGPTVFGIFEDRERAECACEGLQKSGLVRMAYLTVPFQKRR